MFELKPLSREAIPAALEKAVRYRVLNEPVEAESICRDVLEIEPENQEALVTLLLALTDQYAEHLGRIDEASKVCRRLHGEYEVAYYSGIICERRGKAWHKQGRPGCGYGTYEWLQQAMEWYEKAEKLKPEGNDDSVIRWNTCARIIMQHSDIHPRPETDPEPHPMLE